MAATALKEYTIKHHNCQIKLISESKKSISIMAILRTLAREIKQSKDSGTWYEFVANVNRADQQSSERKPILDEEEESCSYIERLMQEIPNMTPESGPQKATPLQPILAIELDHLLKQDAVSEASKVMYKNQVLTNSERKNIQDMLKLIIQNR